MGGGARRDDCDLNSLCGGAGLGGSAGGESRGDISDSGDSSLTIGVVGARKTCWVPLVCRGDALAEVTFDDFLRGSMTARTRKGKVRGATLRVRGCIYNHDEDTPRILKC